MNGSKNWSWNPPGRGSELSPGCLAAKVSGAHVKPPGSRDRMTMQSEQGMALVDDSRGQHSHSETCAACSSGQQAPLRTRFSLHSQKAKAGIRSAMRRIIATVNPEPVMRRNTSKMLALKGRMSISRLLHGRQVMIFFAWEKFWGPQPGATDFVSVSGLISVSGDPLDSSS